MDASEGIRVISVAKSLDAFQRGDANISKYFGATLLAGHAGLFLSSLRGHTRMSWGKFRTLAATAHIDTPILNMYIFPWMKNWTFVEGNPIDDKSEISCNVLNHESVLQSTSQLFANLSPSNEEKAVVEIVNLGAQMPMLSSEIMSKSIDKVPEADVIKRATDLAKGYKIINVLEGDGIKEPVIYSPLIWGDKISKAGKVLSHLATTRREILLNLIDQIRKYQGMPLVVAANFVKQNGEPDLVEFAVGIGLLDKTQILGGDGVFKEFLTTPHIYGELAATQGKDVCDRIRLFLDSIRHGEHYGKWYTGRISDPSRLLTKLIDSKELGPCTAIGHDYQLVEKAGVVNIRPSKTKTGQFIMELVQEDTVRLVRDIVVNRAPAVTDMPGKYNKCNQSGFVSAESTRAQLGEQPTQVREAELEMIRQLREM